MEFDLWSEGPEGARCLLFLHGYPDDHSLWDDAVRHFSKECLCLSVDFPNSGKRRVGRVDAGFERLARGLHATLAARPGGVPRKLTIVCHDWGAVYGYAFARLYPETVEAIVAVDVGASVSNQENPIGYLLIPAYQLGLAGAYLASGLPVVGGAVSKVLSAGVMSGFGLLSKRADGSRLAGPRRRSPFSSLQNAPYWVLWKSLFTGKAGASARLPRVPVLFIHGRQGMKRLMRFHDDAWIRFVESTPGGRAVSFDEAGHWAMLDEPARFTREVEELLARTGGARRE